MAARASEDIYRDPLEELFTAQFAAPAELRPVNLRAITPYHRALMSIDGTVTKFIEAFRMEPVNVSVVSQEYRILAEDHEWLDAPQGAPVIAREVVLRGALSNRFYAFAPSLLVVDRLPDGVREQLDVHPQGIGRIIAEANLETRREILWYGREQLDPPPPGTRHDMYLSRTYRIVAEGRPLMLINEKFPTGDDALPSHH
jgi:chorismate-pyruvate lyase